MEMLARLKLIDYFDYYISSPEGKHCPIGTIEPRDCGPLSSCPKGSVKRVYYGGIIGFAVIGTSRSQHQHQFYSTNDN